MTIDQTLQIAVQHHQAGRLDEAERQYQQILAEQPDNPDALHLLGVIAAQTSRHERAIALINRAIAARPSAREFHSNLGNALRESGRLQDAVSAYRRALEIMPDSAADYQNLGATYSQLGQLDDAINAFRQAFRLRSDSPEYRNSFSKALAEGISFCRKTLQRNAADIEATRNLGRFLYESGDTSAAIAAFDAAARLDPNRADIVTEAGVALDLNGEFDKSIAAHYRALRIDPNYAETYFNLGHVYSEIGRFNDSLARYTEASRRKPDWPEAHWNLALEQLRSGDFKRGWAEYEWRWRLPGSPSINHNVAQPMWDGGDLIGKTLLLRPEQGFGDTIQLIRYAPLLALRGGRLLLTTQPELSRLMRCVTEIQLVSPGSKLEFDSHCPLMRLPLIFGTTLKSIPDDVPYLRADPGLVEAWGKKLASRGGALKIGLSWAGLATHQNDRNRSISLAMLAPLAAVKGIDFYSLQKGPAAAQASNPPPAMRLVDLTGDVKDFADTAALMSHLDLIISIDTSVVHLAGALGKPVWTMLPFKADWRWLIDREDSPWYPTMRLFRQKSRGAWDEVIAKVAEALAQLRS